MPEDIETWLQGFRPLPPAPLPHPRPRWTWALAAAAAAVMLVALRPTPPTAPGPFTAGEANALLTGPTPWPDLLAGTTAPLAPASTLENLNP